MMFVVKADDESCTWEAAHEDKKKIITSFYNLYALSFMQAFVDKLYFVPPYLPHEIEYSLKEHVVHWFTSIQDALTYSVYREFRHSEEYWSADKPWEITNLKRVEKFASTLVNLIDGSNANYATVMKKIKKQSVGLHHLYAVFNTGWWEDDDYGGEAWAEIVEVLQESYSLRKINDKLMWIDKVLDMQHNCGFVLDKTNLSCLSAWRNKTGDPLSHRANATIQELCRYTSRDITKMGRYFYRLTNNYNHANLQLC